MIASRAKSDMSSRTSRARIASRGRRERRASSSAALRRLDRTTTPRVPATLAPDGTTRADDPLLLYFTPVRLAQPKMAMHTHQSYPVAHL